MQSHVNNVALWCNPTRHNIWKQNYLLFWPMKFSTFKETQKRRHCMCQPICISVSFSAFFLTSLSPSASRGDSKRDQPVWSQCFSSPGPFAGQHLILSSCSPTAWLIWSCQMARDHQSWRSLLWFHWTLSRSKVPLINPICLEKAHIPPAGQHCDPGLKNRLKNERHQHQTPRIRTKDILSRCSRKKELTKQMLSVSKNIICAQCMTIKCLKYTHKYPHS